jgi:hypothetical protein
LIPSSKCPHPIITITIIIITTIIITILGLSSINVEFVSLSLGYVTQHCDLQFHPISSK